MWITVLLVLGLAAWWFVSKTGKKQNTIVVNPKEYKKEDEPDTVTIKVQLDVEKIRESRDEFQKNRIKWSGKPCGPFPIKKFTDAQWSCICDAVGRKRIAIGERYANSGDTPDGVALHPARTVNSMAKHGFIQADGTGAFVCTDFGAKAYEQLPWF